MILLQHAFYRCSYGQLGQMQTLQKTVELTTFCVKSKEKYKCNFFLKNVYSICYASIVDIKN